MTLTQRFEKRIDALSDYLAAASHDRRLFAVIFIIFTANFLSNRPADPDLFARVAVGRLIAVYGSVFSKDPFAYTETLPVWYDHEWLTGYLFYHLSQLGGDAALFIAKLLFAFLSVWVLRRVQQEGQERDSFAVPWLLFNLVGCTLVWNNTIRARVFTWLFVPLFLWILKRHERTGRHALLLILPPTMVIWANGHGGFVLGLILIGVYAFVSVFQQRDRRTVILCAVSLCTAIAVLVNPYGLGYVEYIFGAVALDRSGIEEWRPLSVFSGRGILLIVSFAICLLGSVLQGESLRRPRTLLLGVSLILGLRYFRLAPLLHMVAIGYFTDSFRAVVLYVEKKNRGDFLLLRRGSAAGLVLMLVTACATMVAQAPSLRRFSLDYSTYPVDAIEWLREERSGGKVLVDFNNGSYALWRLHPRFKISLDGRFEECYPPQTLEAVFGAFDLSHPDQQRFLKKVWPDFIILPAWSTAFSNREKFGPEWRVVYNDGVYAVLGLAAIETQEVVAAPVRKIPTWEPLF